MSIALEKNSTKYPPACRKLFDPPETLFCRGNVDLLAHPKKLGVVGSRKMSEYGKRVLERLLPPLIEEDVAIVSGLAFGVDAEAHRITLRCGGKAIAVLGSGIDCIMPQTNARLGEEIAHKGLLVSEYEANTPSQKYFFPARNRIIAALSDVLLVVEGTNASGSLITADFMIQLGKDVAAIPGNIDALLSDGPNVLIKNGAHCITTTDDLFLLFDIEKKLQQKTLFGLTSDEKMIFDSISSEGSSFDAIQKTCTLSPRHITTGLTSLEMKQKVCRTGAGIYIRL